MRMGTPPKEDPEPHLNAPRHAPEWPAGYRLPVPGRGLSRSGPDKFTSEAQQFMSEAQQFTLELNKFTSKVQEFSPEPHTFSPEAQQFTPELNKFMSEAQEFSSEPQEFTPEAHEFISEAQGFTSDRRFGGVSSVSGILCSRLFDSSCPAVAGARRIGSVCHRRCRGIAQDGLQGD